MKIDRIVILSFILIILSVSCANASDLEYDVQNNDVDLEINENINIDLNNDNYLNNDLNRDLENNLDNLIPNEENDICYNEKNSLNSDSSTIHQVSPTTYSMYFNSKGYLITDAVSPGDTLDLSGKFTKRNFIITIPCSITSSQCNAYLTNCMVEFENVTSTPDSHSSVSNLNFNTSIEKNPCVYILGSSYVDVFNCNAYSTGANSNPTLLVGSTYCNVYNNVFETTFTGYMNMSWKRAGILLGESHYNNISSNHVTVKDSNPIYLTTYGFEKSNYNIIFNNTVTTSAFSEETGLRNPSAWAYGIHLMGDYNLALNNTIMNTYRGVDSEGSFNQIIGNRIFNLSGSYYEGNNGTDGGEGGIYASYNNVIVNNTIYDSKITGTAIYAVVNNTIYGNVIENITGPYGIQLAQSASNCLIENNTIKMNCGDAVQIKGSMENLTLSNNIISAENGTGILILKQTKAKIPVDVTIVNNFFLENSRSYINYSDVEGKTVIKLENNSVVVVNGTFFRFFDSNGGFDSNELFENFIFKGEFKDLMDSENGESNEKVSAIDLNGKVNIIGDNAYIEDISFNINSNNVKIDSILINITDANANAFNFNNVYDSSLANSIIHFNSTNGDGSGNLIPIYGNNSKISLNNNIIIVYSDNSLLILNNTNCSLADNVLNSSSSSHIPIINDNNSCILFKDNEIISLADSDILSINGAIVKYTYFVIDDSNYHEYFNPDGSFLEDVIFNFGDTITIGNVNNKIFKFDIPLIIVGQKGAVMNNSLIVLEGESSNSRISNFTFRLTDHEYSGDISVITIRDGVGNLRISDNSFYIYNLTGDHTGLNAIKLDPSDIASLNILIEDNDIVIDSNLSQINGIALRNEDLRAYDKIAENMDIANNSISIINHKSDGSANGINLLSCFNSSILNNSIAVKSYCPNGILAEKSNLTIKDNKVNASGLDYEKILDYIATNNLKDLLEENQIKGSYAVSIDRDTYINPDISDVNELIENDAETGLIHSSNSLKDMENIIKNAPNGATVDLGNNVYVIRDTIDLDKSINIKNGILISNLKDDSILFNVLAGSNDSISIYDSAVVLDNSNVFILLNSSYDETASLIEVPSFALMNNEFLTINDKVAPKSINLLKLLSYYESLNPSNMISIKGNQIPKGINVFDFDVRTIADGSDIFISNRNSLSYKTPSNIIYSDMITTAVDTFTDGRAGEYFNVKLTDDKGNPLADKFVQIGFNGKIYNRTTDENGSCRLQINLPAEGVYTFAISFLGDEEYNGTFAVASITVRKQSPIISCSNYYYKASAKSKKISVSLKSASRKPLRNRTVQIVLNGKTYSGKTNSNGLATINVSISKKGTYSFTVKYAGDKTYAAVSKNAKLVIS